jgi:ABC-type tungstate transport system, periplasmic component
VNDLSQASASAFHLLLSGNSEIWEIISLSFSVSFSAILIATPFALLIAFVLAFF